MDTCFVIQPFDKDKFDQRYIDSFKPAITNADLEAYRIDSDPGVRIPIEDIEKGIAGSAICFADITIDNPNVWYELGFAFACGKDVVMVCSDERKEFPFDIRHKQIIRYKTRSSSDFKILEEAITVKLKALSNQKKVVKALHSIDKVDNDGLAGHEVAMLLLIAEHQFTTGESLSVFYLKSGMQSAQYDAFSTGVSIKTLQRKSMVEQIVETDYRDGETYFAVKLTPKGEDWVIDNSERYINKGKIT